MGDVLLTVWAQPVKKKCHLRRPGLGEYIETAHWAWNTFARSLAANYTGRFVGGLFDSPASGDFGAVREEALTLLPHPVLVKVLPNT